MKYLSALNPKDIQNKVCLVRLDFNTEDDWRMNASVPTLKKLLNQARAIVILSHKGRPNGIEPKLSLRKEAKRLQQLLKKNVIFITDFQFANIRERIQKGPKGTIFLLENLRFQKGEGENDPDFAKALSGLGDIYINDAFSVSHRANASVAAITQFLPSYAGLALELEIKNLTKAMQQAKQPLIMVLGGAKIDKKLLIFKNLSGKVSFFLIGGLLNEQILQQKDKKLILPIDFIKENGQILDIGPKTAALFAQYIKKAKTIIWNGPVGKIEEKQFTQGTHVIARAIAENTKAFRIVGGGETVMFLKKLKLDKKINFISTGGGAMLDFLAGKELPGITAL
ncbi:MAG TPA: phosphoglycerate kinase [Candidatus Paceibacterota bacterium]